MGTLPGHPNDTDTEAGRMESNRRVEPGADAAGLRGRPGLVEGIDEACSRIEALDSDIRALLPEADRRSRLLEEAGRLPVEAGAGMPLFGMLVAVKDIIHVDGFETRAGSQLPAEVLAGPEAGCIEALRRAGALVLGKSVTTEFACFKPAATRNPVNLDHTPGGSSSGSAAAVAAGYCPLALGSQTIGSIVRPAAFCGIAGFKPGYGRIDMSGFIHCSPSVDTIGTFTRDVAAAARAASVLCGQWRTGVSAPGRPVLGVPEGPYLEQTEPAAREDFENQLDLLRSEGYQVLEVPALADIEEIDYRHRQMMAAEMARVHEPWFDEHAGLYDEGTAALVEQGRSVPRAALEDARRGRGGLRQELEALMAAEGVDLWACPAATGPAPKGLATTGDPSMNLPWTHAGMPVLGLPAGESSDSGMPLGIQFIAPMGRDEELLAWGAVLERDLAFE